MCTNYVGTRNKAWVKSTFGVELPDTPFPEEAYPGYAAPPGPLLTHFILNLARNPSLNECLCIPLICDTKIRASVRWLPDLLNT